jgi:predicted esterase
VFEVNAIVRRLLKRILGSVLRILAGVPIISLLAGGMLYLVFSATVVGRCVGLSAVILGTVSFCSVGYWNRPWFKRVRRYFYAVLLPLAAVLYLVPMTLAPGGGAADAPVRNCFLGGQSRFVWYSPWNIIPERDQLKVGLSIASFGPPEIDAAETKRIRSLVLPFYDEMDKDADFRALGSVMGMAYRDLCHLGVRTGHYYVCLPGNVSGGERLPCLIFLHGMGGNVKACLWVLAKLSDQAHCAVIAPTFGFGYWDRPGGAEFVVDVTREALATLPLDPQQVFLMGYSNGAMGVTRAAIQAPRLFKGLIYLSPVTEDELFSEPEFLSRASDRKILFLQGGRDQRIPRSFVAISVASLRQLGCDVHLKVYAEEDHYLLFSQQGAVLGDLRAFMAE